MPLEGSGTNLKKAGSNKERAESRINFKLSQPHAKNSIMIKKVFALASSLDL